MSISVDDLVASLSGSHIGQEAIDLAALQAQLAQVLFGHSTTASSPAIRHPISRRPSHTQPCSTPIGRTPPSSFSFGQVSGQWQSSSYRTVDDKEEMEDELMVEDILIPSSPTSSPHFTFAQNNGAWQPTHSKTPSSSFTSSPLQESTFTSTDPFYLAQTQAMQSYGSSTQPAFAQAGQPPHNSPFMLHQQQAQQQSQRRDNHGFNHIPSLDNHSLFLTASAFGH